MLSSARLFCISMFLAVTGCAATGTDAAYLSTQSNSLGSDYAVKFANEQIQLSKTHEPGSISLTEHYLLSAQALLNAHLTDQAAHFLNLSQGFEPTPSQNIKSWRSLLQAQLYWQQHQCSKAEKTLQGLSIKSLGPTTTTMYYELLHDLHQCQGQITKSIQAKLSAVDNQTLKNNPDQIRALWELFQSIDKLPDAKLKKASTLTPWYSLLSIARRSDDISAELQSWRMRWQNHPAELLAQGSIAPNVPHKIAVLLPDSGAYADSAEHVKDGILAAFYAHPNRANLQLSFYDTQSDVVKKYHQAVIDGADVVIGPLVKQDLVSLAKSKPKDLPTPIIGLNTSEKISFHPNMYQFSLSPEDELYYLAKQMVSDSYHKLGVLYPDNDYGRRLADSFNKFWQQQGGEISSVAYDSDNDQSVYVRQLLDIDASQARSKLVRQLTLRKIHSVPRRRQDIDAIVLISDESSARQIRPLLDFYYAENLPVYATSSVYSGIPDAKRDRDLNDIRFCDIPWLLSQNHPKRPFYNEYLAIYETANAQQIRLFAMGLDAFSLALNVSRLEQFPSLGYPGATGVLRVTENNRILRQPSWAHFKNGLPIMINKS